MKKRPLLTGLLLALVVVCVSCSSPDPSEQTLENKGSDTIVNLALAWAEFYQLEYPDVRISVTGGGSGTGIAALINDTVDIANASRQIKIEEIEKAQSNGIDPIEFVIARDAIAVIVNPENPVSELTLQQISDIYSGKITNWNQVGEPLVGTPVGKFKHMMQRVDAKRGIASLCLGGGNAVSMLVER